MIYQYIFLFFVFQVIETKSNECKLIDYIFKSIKEDSLKSNNCSLTCNFKSINYCETDLGLDNYDCKYNHTNYFIDIDTQDCYYSCSI